MKTNIIRVSILLLIAVTSSYLFNGCEASIGTPSGTGSLGNLLPAGETQLRYVAIGNSLTAGYMNGAMYKSGQQMSWTAQMAKQMNVPFVGPYFSDPGVVPDARLFFKGIDAATGLPIISRVSGPILVPAENVSHPSPYNNLGVPGALSFDMLDTSTFAVRFQRGNPLFSLIMRDQAQFGKSIVEQAIRQNPNLITLWIGNNDVLLYAASGGTDSINFPGIPGQGPTPIPVFQNAYNGTVNTLLTSLPKTKIVVANIPDVLATPLATTVPRAAVALTRQGQVDSLRAGYLQVNAAIKAAGRTDTFSFNLGANRIIVADPSVPLIRRRYIRDNEYVLLTAQDSLRVGQGSARPLENQFFLDSAEIAIIQSFTAQYNSIIAAVVEANKDRMALVDINSIFNAIAKNGYAMPGSAPLRKDYISGGIFSLDGVHPTRKGAALIATEFLRVINRTWKSDFPLINPNDVPGLAIE